MTQARWRKCDFQIHTPRDANWSGERPVGIGDAIPGESRTAADTDVEAARQAWAKVFVDACVSKGLQAIALTDHHEMVMIPCVQREIGRRKATDESFDLWLFPGMELTASGGKQCLILFDADLSEDWHRQAQGKLGIVYADLDEMATKAPPRVTQLPNNYSEIGALLDELPGLRGKCIILPNVSQGNSHTVLTDAAHTEFRRMPYVGGYLDAGQTLATIGSKNRARLSGTDDTWSVREIYPLPTSDSRSADFAALGSNNTWIKLAEPTAEAIRQAFLGHHSRITIDPPKLPSLSIESIEVDGSSILGNTVLELSPELNAFIGGRGSGKSSALEYIAFGLGRSCFDAPREGFSGTVRLTEMVNDTLISKGGKVSMTIIQDSARFKVTRGQSSAHQPQITYPNGSTQAITTKELRSLFPAVVYAQGELADIGRQTGKHTELSDLLQFVRNEYKTEDDRLIRGIETSKDAVKAAVRALLSIWSLQADLRKLRTRRDSLKQRVQALEGTLPALSPEDQAAVDRFDQANDFEAKRFQSSRHVEQIASDVSSLVSELGAERDVSSALTEETAEFREAYQAFFSCFKEGAEKLKADLAGRKTFLTTAEATWETLLRQARADRDGALEKLSTHKVATAQIIKFREDVSELTIQIGNLEAKLSSSGDPAKQLSDTLTGLRAANNLRASKTLEWAKEIQTLSNGKIDAAVDSDGDTSEIVDALELVASKTGSQEATRQRELAEAIAGDGAVAVSDKLRTDCLSLIHWRLLAAASGAQEPVCADLMKVLGNTPKIRGAIGEQIDGTKIEAIAAAVTKPRISLSYCDGSKKIAFEKASEGQRAAALLFMLLEQPGGPLQIDQPEGDLDNKIITELTEKLHKAKQKRQLIFVSHNANIVVNGSAELVAHLDVRETGERYFSCTGAIDSERMRDVITSTIEGGERAFRDRQSKYGY